MEVTYAEITELVKAYRFRIGLRRSLQRSIKAGVEKMKEIDENVSDEYDHLDTEQECIEFLRRKGIRYSNVNYRNHFGCE